MKKKLITFGFIILILSSAQSWAMIRKGANAGNPVKSEILSTISATFGDHNGVLLHSLKVNSFPNVVATAAGATSFCSGGSVTINATLVNNDNPGIEYTYQWRRNDEDIADATTSSYTATSGGVYSVIISDGSNFSEPSNNVTVTVYSLPDASVTPDGATSFCFGESVTLNANNGSGLSYQWKNETIDITGATSSSYEVNTGGDFSVTVTNSQGCSKTSGGVGVTVFSLPEVISIATGATSFCRGENVEIIAKSESELTYKWRNGTSEINGAINASLIASENGDYNVVVTDINGCSETSNTVGVTVFSLPEAVAAADGSTLLCPGGSVNLKTNDNFDLSYQWMLNNEPVPDANTFSIEAALGGNYTVMITDGNGCKNTSDAITVSFIPYSVASFTVSQNPLCSGGLVDFTNTSANYISSQWMFDNGNTSALSNPTQVFSNSGSYNVKLITENVCGYKDSALLAIRVWENPVATFNVKNGCKDENLSFVSNSTGNMDHFWTFGDASTSLIANPDKAYSTAGVYDVQLIITDVNGCKDTAKTLVSVYPRPVVSFVAPINVCEGASSTFTNTTSLSSGTFYNEWNFGDGKSSIENNPTKIYNDKGNYTVVLTSTSDYGCSASYENIINVNSKPKANFKANPVCKGTATEFINITEGGAAYEWDFGDAIQSTLTSPIHTYTTAGIFNAKLTAKNSDGCEDVITKTINVFINPLVNFTVNDNCFGLPTNFGNFSTDGSQMHWQFGDGNISSDINPTYTYLNPGNYNVKLSVISEHGCISSLNKLVKIFASPKAAFGINNKQQCFNGNSFIFTDNSTISNGTYTHQWSFDNQETSTVSPFIKSYTNYGVHDVKLVITSNNGCKDSAIETVKVYPNPTADFTINNSSQCFNDHLFVFKDESSISAGYISSSWSLGDGYFSSGTNVIKKYATSGNYTVNLTTVSEFGCMDNVSKIISINPNPVASFTVNEKTQCLNENSFAFTNTSSGTTFNSLWQFGDENLLSATNANHAYTAAGLYKVMLKVNSPYGCNDSAYYSVKVLANPANISITGPSIIKNGSSQNYSVPLNLGSTYNWSVINGTILSNGANRIQIKWGTAGIAGVLQVMETGSNGCPGSVASYNVTLTPMSGYSGTIHKNAFAAYLYPNPAKEHFTVVAGNGELVTMTIFDQLGRIVLSDISFNSSITINDTYFATGIYTLRLTNSNGKATLLRLEVRN